MTTGTIILNDAAAICPHGDIDHDALPALRAASAALPDSVRSVTWTLDQVAITDVAALRLLHEQQAGTRQRSRTLFVRGPRPQHHRLLALAASLFPAVNLEALRNYPGLGVGQDSGHRQRRAHRHPEELRRVHRRQSASPAPAARTRHRRRPRSCPGRSPSPQRIAPYPAFCCGGCSRLLTVARRASPTSRCFVGARRTGVLLAAANMRRMAIAIPAWVVKPPVRAGLRAP
ncbi:lipid asymmetry maintenance protein MlaB [Streptomyces sp. NPDC057197]|uniref:STAS domain-containing protein n=1 Tax=Streptomyces sp. NPDC057197 TaxID=3346045 RepID=UPI003633AA10